MILSLIDYSKCKAQEANFKFWDELPIKNDSMTIDTASLLAVSSEFEYQFKQGGPSFNIVATYDDKKERYILFATNKKAESTEKLEKTIPGEYRKRSNIETGYRVKNNFKIRSCTKSPVARVLFFIIQYIMYNVLNILKSVVEITAYELKSSINEDINKAVRYGLKSLNLIPVKVLLDCLRWLNEERNRVLHNRLTII